MKKRLFTGFLKRRQVSVRSLPVSSLFERSGSQHLFLSGLRCPSGQLQIVAIRLPFLQTDTVAFPARFR